MKKLLFSCLIAGACLGTSCNNQEEINLEKTYPYTFTGFEVNSGSIEDLTRATESDVFSMLVVDVVNDTYVQKVERIASESALDDLTLDLSYGSHKIYFVLGRQAWANFDETSLSVSWNESSQLGETWSAVVPVDVTGPEKDQIEVKLLYSIAYTRLHITDAIPANVSYIRQVLVGGSWTFDLLNQCGGTASTITRQVNLPSSYLGQKDVKLGICSFVPNGANKAESYSLTAYSTQGESLVSRTFTDVELVAGQYVSYKGCFFSSPSSNSSFLISYDNSYEEKIIEFNN